MRRKSDETRDKVIIQEVRERGHGAMNGWTKHVFLSRPLFCYICQMVSSYVLPVVYACLCERERKRCTK